jgi:hypothetical protein
MTLQENLPTLPDGDRPATAWTRPDLARLLAAHREIEEFQRFALARFVEYTASGQATGQVRGYGAERAIEPITEGTIEGTRLREPGGWGSWSVKKDWRTTPEADHITVAHFMADDRGPGTWGLEVKVPKAWIFGEIQTSEDFQTYLILKARFEGGEDTEGTGAHA